MNALPLCITGIGQTPPVRRSDKSLRQLVVEASLTAIRDAGLHAHDIDGIVTDSVIMPTSVPHDWLAGQLGITSAFDAASSYGGAGIVGAPRLAELALRRGLCRHVLVYFGLGRGAGLRDPYEFHQMYPAKIAYEQPQGFNAQPIYFALMAERYRHEFGLPDEVLGTIAVTQRDHVVRSGIGQKNSPLTMQQYLETPMISDPLRYADCCLISEGAAAYILTLEDRAIDAPHKTVYVRGVGFGSESTSGEAYFSQRSNYLEIAGARAAARSLEIETSMALKDTDFAELYDCCTISCLLQMEDLGLCERGDAGRFVLEGGMALDGTMPINTHGGLLAHSYLLGAEHVVEAVRQLRGSAANQVSGAKAGIVSGLSVPDYALLMLSN